MNATEHTFTSLCKRMQGGVFTLSWAQSLNGALSAARNQKTVLSGDPSMHLVHRLRAMHPSILVGVGTILADNPRLTVRFAPGPSPRAVVIDPRCRMPLDARLWGASGKAPLIVCAEGSDPDKRLGLEAKGAEVLVLPSGPDGKISWQAIALALEAKGLGPVMVEGGVAVHEGIMKSGLGFRLLATICPRIMEGPSVGSGGITFPTREFKPLGVESYGQDLVWFGSCP